MPRKTNWLKNKSKFLFGISLIAAWMLLLSLTVPHLNLCIMCVSHIEFHIESEIIFCQCSCTQTTSNLIWPQHKKVLNASASLFFCSFGLFFCHIFDSIVLVVCSRSLILLLSSLFLYFKTIFICICRTQRIKWQNIRKSSGIFTSVM